MRKGNRNKKAFGKKPKAAAKKAEAEAKRAIVRKLMNGDQIEHKGEFFELHELYLRPRPVRPGGPRIYAGGESPPGRALAAGCADVFLINGRPLEQIPGVLAEVACVPRKIPAPLKFGMSAFVIARPSADEAMAEYRYLLELSQTDNFTEVFKGADAKAAMFKLNADMPVVGTNGGTTSGLVGSYDEVADRMLAFHEAGIETFMLQFQPIEPELDRFIAEVAPRVRRLEKVYA